MVPCKKNHEFDGGWDQNSTFFCPDYGKDDLLYGGYYSEKYSWLRLVIHRCDPNEIIVVNKKKVKKSCATRDEQDTFFAENILNVLIHNTEPSLQSDDSPINKFNIENHYSVKHQKEYTEFHEYYVQRSKIELNNDLTGFWDNTEEIEIAQLRNGGLS